MEEDGVDDRIKALMAIAKKHELTPDDLFGFIFEAYLNADAAQQIKAQQKLLAK
jgi:hypothetical protein